MSVHYKFKNSRDSDTVILEGPFISVGDLKRAIIQKQKLLKVNDCELRIINNETNEGKSKKKSIHSQIAEKKI